MLYVLLFFSITGNDIIQKVDSIMNAPEDREEEVITIIIDKDGNKKERETLIYEKGDMRMIRFMSPAEDRGISFLSLSEDRMYIYLPSFNKIRRIASHVKKQPFLDTDFSYNDLGTARYTEEWDAEIEGEDDSTYFLKLIPEDEDEYSLLKMTVKKVEYLIREIEFYKDDKVKKVLRMKDYKNIDNYTVATVMEMTSVEDNHKTIMKIEKVSFDQGLSDGLFTQRNLKKI